MISQGIGLRVAAAWVIDDASSVTQAWHHIAAVGIPKISFSPANDHRN
jgi:hypothetical protein